MKRIYLIDSPGIVPPSNKDSEADILFRGVVRVEHVSHAEQYIPELLKRVQKKHLERTYELSGWENAEQFLEKLARKSGRLLKGAEPDMAGVAKQVIKDFNRGKIPWFVPPPEDTQEHSGKDKKASYKKKRAERAASKAATDQKNNESKALKRSADDDENVPSKKQKNE